MIRALLLVLALLLVAAGHSSADYLKVQRAAIVHEDPDGDSEELSRVEPGDLLPLRAARLRSGYYHVTVPGSGEGWVYKTFVRRFPGDPPGTPNGGNLPEDGTGPAPAASGALDASAFMPSDCPPEGTAKRKALQQLNRLKNRAVGPAPGVVTAIELDDLIYPGDDRDNWKSTQAIEVVGYVFEVKKGGVETCNCGATEEIERDTHIEIVRDPDNTAVSERVIVEVTPTWRRYMQQTHGVDWSTAALKTRIKDKWVKVRGWMLFDEQHTGNAVNANPSGSLLWRATAWEIHPITSLEVVPAPVQ